MRVQCALAVSICLMLLIMASCSMQGTAPRRYHGPSAARPRGFVLPYDADVYLSPAGGAGAANSDLGTCAEDPVGCEMLFQGLPYAPVPAGEIKLGSYAKGAVICFCMKTTWRGNEHWTFSSSNDALSQIVFRDLDGSLGLRGQSIAERVSPEIWVLHLDDGASFLYDDNDGDVLMRIRLEKR